MVKEQFLLPRVNIKKVELQDILRFMKAFPKIEGRHLAFIIKEQVREHRIPSQ